MNIAVIIAGGVGNRTGQEIPKQFINIYDKPVIIYTLERFEKHPLVDAIEVVCIDGWQEILKAYARQFGITKLKWVTTGGATGQESIRNGIFALREICQKDDIVIIHDGIRPMVDSSVLSDVLSVAEKYGNGVASLPYNEQIFVVDAEDATSTVQYIPRETLRRVQTPQAYHYGEVYEAYKKAFEQKKGIYGSAYVNTMMVELGYRLYFAKGSDKNFKITTKDDLDLLKAYLKAEEGV